jgi:hypothetical protein
MTTYARRSISNAMMYNAGVLEKAAEHITNMSTRNSEGKLSFDPITLIEERCGRYTRGKHKGELRGTLHVLYAERGGWIKKGPGYMNGRVTLPGQVHGIKITTWAGNTLLAYGEVF